MIRELMQYESVGVALPDGEDAELRLYIVDSAGQLEVKSEHVSGLAEKAFRTGRPLIAIKEELAADCASRKSGKV